MTLLMALLAGCRQPPADSTPELVVQAFIDRMLQVHGDPARARDAYDLLWSGTQRQLGLRAERASNVAGRKVAPEDMIAPSRFWLKFVPMTYRAEVQGDWALVTVARSKSEAQQVRCVREDRRWRVVLDLPALEPVRRREYPEPG